MRSSFCWDFRRVQLLRRISSVEEAARCLSASSQTVRRWILPVRQGRRVRIHLPTAKRAKRTDTSPVIAAATFGSVIRSRNQNFTLAGGVDYDGQRARTPSQLEALNKYSDRLRDYCHYGDPMCAVGSTPANVYVHLDYFLERNQEVVQWIVGKAKSSSSNNNNNNNNNNINGQVSNGSTPSTSIFPSDTPTPSSIMPTQTSTAIQSTTSSQPNASSFTNTLFQSSSSSVLAKPAIATSTAASLPTGSQSPTGSGSTGAASSMVSSCFLVSLLSALTAVLV
jgi:hypothetical protein